MDLQTLGFDEWFKEYWEEHSKNGFSPARVVSVHKNRYLIRWDGDDIPAELTGKFLFAAGSSIDLPTVGDWVVVQLFDANALAIIHEIFPRKTVLKRKDPGKVDFQLLAANVDFAFIMQGLDQNFNLNRLDRYIVAVHQGGLQPVILLSKSDLLSPSELQERKQTVRERHSGIGIITFSNLSGDGVENIVQLMQAGKTYCLLGSSGVGKTSLLNTLLRSEKHAVNEVRSGDGRGKHTTTSRELIILNNGSLIIDTPGLRELGNFDVRDGLAATFDDIEKLAARCRFSDCRHISEAGCAVLEAVESGEIDPDRYENFQKIRREAAFYEMNYVEKRRRDKEQGKFYRSVVKNNRKINFGKKGGNKT